MKHENCIKDALYYATTDCNDNADHARGVLVGLVNGMMASGLNYQTAIKTIVRCVLESHNLSGFQEKLLPDCWRQDYYIHMDREISNA